MSPEAYVDLYRTMVRIRAFEETVRRYHIAGKAPGLVHLCTGQEAVPAGTTDVTWDIWDRSQRYLAEVPHGGRVREFTRTDPAEVVFDVSFRDPHDALAWQVYGGFRTPSLYPGEGAGATEHLP